MAQFVSIPRRSFLFFTASAVAALVVRPDTSSAAINSYKTLALHARWSGERFNGPYAENNRYIPEALDSIGQLYRDRHNGMVHLMDVRLLDLLHDLTREAAYNGSVEVVCGYRSPATNKMLRKKGVRAAKDSLHLRGQAIDIRLQGVKLARARDIAVNLRAGGVGYYRKRNFLHLDVGPVRTW